MLNSLNNKQKIIFFIILLLMILVIIYYFYISIYKENFTYIIEESDLLHTSNNISFNNTNNLSYKDSTFQDNQTNTIIVYVCGAVKESKVVNMKENSRIYDAIKAVGGLTSDADLTNINLASILEDGEKIYIPKKGEILNAEASSSSGFSTKSNNSYSTTKNNKININKATQTQLELIPGIGPSTALKIITYRKENGNFFSIEDIKNVSGIGELKYEKIKNYICVK